VTIRAAMRRRLARLIDRLPGATSFILLAVGMPSRVRNDSQFLLDGYPRSANTLACFRIQTMNPGLQFAHHTHKPSQLKKAVRLGIPVIVLVRRPLDAVRSVLRVDPRAYEVNECLKDYVQFYKASLLLPSNQVRFVKFETVVDPSSEAFSLLVRASTGITAVASVALAQNALGPHLEAVGYENYVNRIALPTAGDSRNIEETQLDLNLKPNPKLLSEASEIYERVLSQAV
jgi:hypothetical protein